VLSPICYGPLLDDKPTDRSDEPEAYVADRQYDPDLTDVGCWCVRRLPKTAPPRAVADKREKPAIAALLIVLATIGQDRAKHCEAYPFMIVGLRHVRHKMKKHRALT